MNRIDPEQEQQNIRVVLDRNPEIPLREIHQHLANMEESNFIYSPTHGEKWNDERWIVRALKDILRMKKGHVTNEKSGSNQTWSLTRQAGRQCRGNDILSTTGKGQQKNNPAQLIMSAFLIQVSGHSIHEKADPKYIQGAQGPRFCDEPLVHGEYFNADPFWKREGYGRKAAWQNVASGDRVLLYCSSSVDEHGACLSHLLTVDSVSINAEGARLEFSEKQRLVPTISYTDIMQQVESGQFSDSMAYCGQEGFNFTQITSGDINRVRELCNLE